MSANLVTKPRLRRFGSGAFTLIGEPVWLIASLVLAAVLLSAGEHASKSLVSFFTGTLGELVAGALLYAIMLAILVVPTWWRRGGKGIARLLGITKRPSEGIVLLPILAFVAYLVLSVPLAYLSSLLPWVDMNQKQDVGFEHLSGQLEYVFAFIALVVLPPLFEETIFRGYLFGKLRSRFGFWLSALVVSIIFGLAHLQWNVSINVAMLSVLLCVLRERTGSIWAGMVVHALKNGLAYYFLFINPSIN